MTSPARSLASNRVCWRSPFFSVILESESEAVAAAASDDFACFCVPEIQPSAEVFYLRYFNAARPRENWRSLFTTPRSQLFASPAGESRVKFYGKAWVDYRPEQRQAEIYCDDDKVGYETCYMLLLSIFGESFDLAGRHRIHGFGMSTREGKGVLFMAPSGGGKSTLAMKLLEATSISILSDDTPLVDGNAQLHPLPLRIGMKERPALPEKFVRVFDRVMWGRKYSVGYEFFRKRVGESVPLVDIVLLGRGKSPRLRRVSRLRLLWPFCKWLIVGYETPQTWEFYVRRSFTDVLRKVGIVVSRLRTARSLLRARAWSFEAGPDASANVACLEKELWSSR